MTIMWLNRFLNNKNLSVWMQHCSCHNALVLGFWQEEYEELLRYAVVNPNVESGVSRPSHLRGEAVPDRFPVLGMLHQPGYVQLSRYQPL